MTPSEKLFLPRNNRNNEPGAALPFEGLHTSEHPLGSGAPETYPCVKLFPFIFGWQFPLSAKLAILAAPAIDARGDGPGIAG